MKKKLFSVAVSLKKNSEYFIQARACSAISRYEAEGFVLSCIRKEHPTAYDVNVVATLISKEFVEEAYGKMPLGNSSTNDSQYHG